MQLYSVLLTKVKKSGKLLKHINDINAGLVFGRMFFHSNAIVVAHELVAETLDPQELNNACVAIGSIADRLDTQLQSEFGGDKAADDPDVEDIVEL